MQYAVLQILIVMFGLQAYLNIIQPETRSHLNCCMCFEFFVSGVWSWKD